MRALGLGIGVIVFWFVLVIALSILQGCGQKQWSSRGYKKGWIKSDTIRDTILTKSVSFDTLFTPGNDTTIIHKGKLTEKFYYNTKTNTVYLKGECKSDTIIVEKHITRIETKESKFNGWIEKIFWVIVISLVACFSFRVYQALK